jgi:flagellar biosynthesis/type III secretory pathway protein FliH
MGKVVKQAQISDAKYLVNVPEIDARERASAAPTGDERFEAQFPRPEPSFNEGFSLSNEAESVAPAPSVDFNAVKADAEAIVDRAAADAERMIKEAESAALTLVSGALARASEVQERAQSSGHDEGYKVGHEAASAELKPVIATFRDLVEGVRAARQAVITSAEPELVRLAMAIAERIVHTEVANNQNVIVENVRNALTRLVTREVVTLRVNPTDLDTIRQYRDSIVAASDVEHLRVVEDQRVDRGGVVVETEAGTIDAKIATQLREAKRALLTEDAIALDTDATDAELLSPSAHVS